MKGLSLIGVAALSLSLSPLAPAAASDESVAASPRLPVHKALALFHIDGESGSGRHCLSTQAATGAFLEMTSAAP